MAPIRKDHSLASDVTARGTQMMVCISMNLLQRVSLNRDHDSFLSFIILNHSFERSDHSAIVAGSQTGRTNLPASAWDKIGACFSSCHCVSPRPFPRRLDRSWLVLLPPLCNIVGERIVWVWCSKQCLYRKQDCSDLQCW